jgi:hypothetical protein
MAAPRMVDTSAAATPGNTADQNAGTAPVIDHNAPASASQGREVVFVDLGIPEAETLLSDLEAQQTAGRPLDIVRIGAGEDGISVISAYLSAPGDEISAVHILSHGDQGWLQLGQAKLDLASLSERLGEVSTWGSRLASDADLLLYGCDLAASEAGRELVDQLALLSGADVAASDDRTGAAILQGDWELEYTSGTVDSGSAISQQAQASWQQVLATLSFQDGTNGYAGTVDTLIESGSPTGHQGGSGSLAFDDSSTEQALIRFDSIIGAGASQIPLGSTITSASLTVFASEDGTGNPALYRVLSLDWDETSTWNSLVGGVQRDNAEANISADSSVDASTPGSRTFTGLATTVQAWANGGANRGWLLMQDGNEWIISSSENGTVGNRPSLSVTYTAPTPPQVDLDASGAGRNFSTTFTENGAAVKIADTDASVTAGTNTISTSLTSMTVTISNLLDGAAESLAATTTGTNIVASYNSGTGVLSLTGTDTAANYQTVLRTVTYNNTDDTPSTTSRTINVVVTDAYGGSGTTATSTMAVVATNDAPVISSNAGGASASISVAENATAVTTVVASDPEGTALTYSVSGTDAARFSISSSTGVLTFSPAPNYESPTDSGTDNVYNVTVTASDGSATDTQALTITVTDVDEFDVGAVTDGNGGANSVSENVANGTTVGVTGSASDADGTTNTITYSLSDNAGGRFTIHGSTGVITVANGTLLNYESATSHSVTILATSADGSSSSQSFTINLVDVDEFDVGAVADGNAGANDVAENASNGSTVGVTASASDADGSNNTITYSLSDAAGGRFTIHASTGVVTVANGTLLNYETAASYVITALATSSDGSSSSQNFTINLTDVDEFDVGVVSDSNVAANSVAENAANGSTVGLTALASDADGTTNAITYTLSDSAGGRFAVHSSTGVVTVADGTLLNYEAATSHSITVLATSADGSFSSQSFTVNLSDVDEFDVGAVTDGNAGANSVAENATNGSTVGLTALATDADGTTNTITYSLSDAAGGRFAIHSSTGVVTVANGTLLNYESATSHSITVLATSADGSFSSQSFTVNLSDVDEFDVGAVTDSNAGANSVVENAANGSTVGVTALATDADGTTNTITYSLSNSAGGRFTIDGSTGVVTVADGSLLNYEGASSHSITVLATSADSSTSSQSFTINLSDVDEFDVGAVTDGNVGANSVAENAANGSTVGVTALATDADGTTNTITYTLSDSAGGRFAIHSGTGIVTVADGSLLNYESATSHNITVLATSADGSFGSQSFTVNLSDVDEFDVGAVTDSNAGANSLAENAANGTTVGVTALATDADGTTNTITYSLSDAAGGRFAIHSSTGVVTVANGTLLNYESATSHSITVLATSADSSTSSQSFTINLSDVDEFDVGVVTDSNAGANSVAENAANGSTVGVTALATDADGTTNTITYSLSDNAGGRFTIDGSTGVVTVADGSLLNHESATSHSITVLATSADSSTSSQSFTINLSDVDEFDVGAVTDGNVGANSVAENAANGATVGVTALATDADGTTNAITYTLSDDAGGRFAIHGSTGVVTVANGTLLNYESASSHSITVLATSADGSFSSQSFTVNLSDADEFDVGAVTDSNAGSNSVTENAANGSTVGVTALATDADGTMNTVTYSLSDDAGGRFAIHSGTGVVTVADGSLLNHEGATSHSITVLATSADSSTNSQSFTINLSDVDEFDVGAVTDSNAGANSVAENAANGSTVGVTASATDADGTTNTITYTLSDNAGGRFSIHSGTGVVTVADGSLLNHESATSHSITVLATSADGSFSSQSFTVNLSDVDEFDVGAVTDSNAGANSVAENAANGTTVGVTATATDADSTTNAITYSLSDSAGGRFAIDSSTGVVTVADGSLLNHESATSHNITVLATSADSSTNSQSFTINLSDVDEFDVGAVTDGNVGANSVAENAANGSTVGVTASATDADGTTNTITYTLSDNAGGRFAIHSNTGVVTVADGSLLNYEAATSHSITVLATSADGSFSSQSFTVNLSDVDEFDVGAVTDSNAGANSVAENAANGSTVGVTALATDADGTTHTITYSLSDSAGGRFAINSSTGVVTVADGSLLNYESATSHSITVLATSADGSTSSQSFAINLSDADEFDVGAVTDSNAGANSVAENTANGSTVGFTASASDADATTNTITYSLSDDAGGRFSIDSSTGVVTVADGSLLNYEAAAFHSITVLATSADGSFSSQSFTVNLSDVDEFDVGAVTDSNAGANSVAENAANGSTVGVTASATDADGTTNIITYTLSDDAGGRFAIHSGTGVVTVANDSLLNYESSTSHSITVLATSADGSTSSQSFVINLSDADEFDVSAVTDSNAAANSVAENAANGSTVGVTALATDTDATTNTVTYSLSDDAGGRFSIDSGTGVVTVADGSLLNHEGATSHSITVLATSADSSTSSQSFTINLSDVDEFDVGAVTDGNVGANSVAENAANGSTVGVTALATDADGTTNTITYTLSDSAGGRFAIHSGTGIVTVADGSLLNYESATLHNITVLATSADGSFGSQSFTVNLSDVDEFDVGAVTDSNAGANSVAENAANGSTVGVTALASDADSTTNAITYSLSDSAGGRFTIHSSTGVVTVADGSLLNHESATSHSITVLATSADSSTSSQSFTINLSDVDEFDVGAVTDSNAGANSVAENAANGSTVGVTALASDADATMNTMTYSLSDDAGGRFTIDAGTGVVTVADGTLLNHESASSHSITVLATSADGSSNSQSFTINLSDVDEFDVGTVTDSNAGANSVAENAVNGSTVAVTAVATDADGSTNTITYTLSDSAGGRFAIDSSTGVVTVADSSSLSYEAATSHSITVLATSADGSNSSQSFTINLSDVDEFDVGAVTDSNVGANSVAENAANGSTVGVTASASDADATTNAITYSLSDSAGGRFAIDSSTGVVTIADGSQLNYESAASHNITVLATSADGSTSSQSFTINVGDVDEFDVGSVSDSNASGNSVAENAANGATVGVTASATDADGTTSTITYTLSDDAGGRFAIDGSTGVVTVADGSLLNHESATSHSITVLATSADSSTSSQSFVINVSDADEFDVGTVTDADAGANSVAENAANGSTVGVTASASDADATTNTITYSLSDDAGGRFSIDGSTGVVTVADGSLLNHEGAASHNITVLATSADSSTSSQSFTINLGDVDEFDVGAVTDSNAGANSVAENAANGSTVGVTASATDADGATNAIAYSLSDDAGGRFAVHSSTGVVTVADGSLLNYEATTSHSITVLATSADGSFSSQSFTVNLSDVDEFDVSAVADANAGANSVAENAANGSTVGVTAAATDADSTTNTVTYSLSDSAGGRFAIDNSTGVVTVADNTSLNYEAATSHSITVLATSADGSTSSQSFTINLTDFDEFDVGAVTDSNAGANSVAENAANGSTVGVTASASDADATTNAITYSLSDSAGGRFAIDSSTGVVTVADGSQLNHEAAASHNITVLATSTDGSTSSQSFTINLSDADEFDVGAVTDSNASTNSVAENAANGETVGVTASATDADDTTNTITYSLSDSAGGRFAIDSATGVITVADGTMLNYEVDSSHSITILATSADGSTVSQSFTINLSDVDEFDVGPISDGNAGNNSVAENAANGSTVGITASSSDADATTNAVTYALSDDAGGRFTINGNTGVVSVADGSLLDHESASSHNITVTATGADGSTSSQSFTIVLGDVDEFDLGPVSDGHAAADSVAENAANGSTVGITASASDADATNSTITYSLSDDAGGRFTIHGSTGVVTVGNGALLNYEAITSHSITVLAVSADGSTSSQSFTINLSDADEFDIGAVADINADANSVSENAANGSAVGITASASDADATTNAVTYSLSDDAGGRFAIHATTGVITVAHSAQLDHETATSHSIAVLATSADGSSSSTGYTVLIGAANDNAPQFNAASSHVTIAERTTSVATLNATDADQPADTLVYSIAGGNDGGRFAIDAATGALAFRDAPQFHAPTDADGDNRYEVIVQATDGTFNSSIAVYAEVLDAFEPYFPPAPPNIPEASTPPQVTEPETKVDAEPVQGPSKPEPDNAGAPSTAEPVSEPGMASDGTSGGDFLLTGSSQMGRTWSPTGMNAAGRPAISFLSGVAMSDTHANWLQGDTGLQVLNAMREAQTVMARLGIPVSGLTSAHHVSFVENRSQDEGTLLSHHAPQAMKVSGLAMSVGTVWWAARASGLVASMVVSAPAWRSIDPLPVLFNRSDDAEASEPDNSPLDGGDREEALAEQMFDQRSHSRDWTPIG